jgi:hypothetical protein
MVPLQQGHECAEGPTVMQLVSDGQFNDFTVGFIPTPVFIPKF